VEWLYGLIGAAFLGLVALVWNLLNEKIREHKEDCDKEISKLWDQIGRDSFSGMRKSVHEETGSRHAFMELDKRVDVLERK
jgi:hypothetical protein